jgi:hypothetical protein
MTSELQRVMDRHKSRLPLQTTAMDSPWRMQVGMTPKRPPIQMNGDYIPPAPNMMPNSFLRNVNDYAYQSIAPSYLAPEYYEDEEPPSQIEEVEKRGAEIRAQKYGPELPEGYFSEEEAPETITTDIPQEEGTS